MGDEAEETIDFLSGRLCKTWQRFLPTGPVAILPLWDGMASIVWSNTIENTKMLKECTKEEFVLKLNEAFQENNIGSKLPSFLPQSIIIIAICKPNFIKAPTITELCIQSHPFHYNFHSTHMQKGVFNQDAVHTVRPTAGQGLNLD